MSVYKTIEFLLITVVNKPGTVCIGNIRKKELLEDMNERMLLLCVIVAYSLDRQ